MDEVITLVKETETDKYNRAAVRLLEEHTAEDLVAAFLKSLSKDATDVPVKITPERPLPSRKGKGGGYKGGKGGGGYKGNRSSSDRRGGGERGGERSFKKNRSSDSNPRSGGKRYDDKRGGGSSASAPKKSSHSFTIRNNND